MGDRDEVERVAEAIEAGELFSESECQTAAAMLRAQADTIEALRQRVEVQPTAYAWRWKGSDTWKLTFRKKPNHHPGIEIKELFESKPAALTARLNAERRACATECEMCPDENWGQWMAALIMARCEGG